MLNDPRSHGLWERTAPAAPVTMPLSGLVKTDVAVIGAGFTGCSAALHLAQGGARVVVLEKAEVGFGAAGRNVGLANAGMWVMPQDIIKELGEDHGNRILNLLGNGPNEVWAAIEKYGIACEATHKGTLHLALGKAGLKELEERCAQWSARGAPVALLDKAETERRVGSSAYEGSLLDMRAGTVQPLAYVRGLARAALAAGAAMHTASPVLRAEVGGRGWRLVTPQGAVEADWVIVATDAYTTQPFAELRLEQVHLPYFNFATTPLSPEQRAHILPGLEGCWDTKEVLNSFRMDAAGRLVFGSVGALKGPGAAIHRAYSRRALARLFPALKGVGFESEWYGMIGMTTNNLPRFHRLGHRVISFSGYNGRGIGTGTVFGRVLAEHILGKIAETELPLPLSAPTPIRRRRLKELYYETGAQAAHFVDQRI